MICLAKFISVLHSGTRSVAADSPLYNNWEDNYALHVVVDITSGDNLVVSVLGRDTESNKDYTILTSALLASGVSVLKVGPELTAGTNVAKDYVPANFHIYSVPSGSTVFSIGASLI